MSACRRDLIIASIKHSWNRSTFTSFTTEVGYGICEQHNDNYCKCYFIVFNVSIFAALTLNFLHVS